MTQETYNIIVKVLHNGCPALANELICEINALIQEVQSKKDSADENRAVESEENGGN